MENVGDGSQLDYGTIVSKDQTESNARELTTRAIDRVWWRREKLSHG